MREFGLELVKYLKDVGFAASVVDIGHLADLEAEFRKILEIEEAQSFVAKVVSRYDLDWEFTPAEKSFPLRSVIVVAAPQPSVKVDFHYRDDVVPVTIPPTYIHSTDQTTRRHVKFWLGRYGYKVRQALLPEKLLTVCSGLGRYGRNNITYIQGFGSYFRQRVFFSEMPVSIEQWLKPQMLEACETCSACIQACPTGAIREDRFLIDGERCLTYWNEGDQPFPDWMDASWHHCLEGCMRCQQSCPSNRSVRDWWVSGGEFSESETEMLLAGEPRENLPSDMLNKLKLLNLEGEYGILQRNLSVLMQ